MSTVTPSIQQENVSTVQRDSTSIKTMSASKSTQAAKSLISSKKYALNATVDTFFKTTDAKDKMLLLLPYLTALNNSKEFVFNVSQEPTMTSTTTASWSAISAKLSAISVDIVPHAMEDTLLMNLLVSVFHHHLPPAEKQILKQISAQNVLRETTSMLSQFANQSIRTVKHSTILLESVTLATKGIVWIRTKIASLLQ